MYVSVPTAPVESLKAAHFVATGTTPEGVKTTAELWYLLNDADSPETSDYSEHMTTTYHYSDAYGEEDVTLNDARNVSWGEMNRSIRIAVEEYGYTPFN